ncbi:DNA-binding transcriptional regulator AraC [Ktedonospora formicarum]|uniref:DNA-binding transcriptional regulator AraC n=2 Tax=Ktedonospora formicarum TaxID=2778364 RepID=A0A8J3HZ03_9CHLR|nr:DNA-binding transcriptional regulator AraC [Ktedonospora formicarum]
MVNFETPAPPPDIFVSGYLQEHYGYAVQRSRGSGNWLITYTIAGQGLYRLHKERILAEPGDLVILKTGASHDYSVPRDGTWEFLWAHFLPLADWTNWLHLPELCPGLCKISLHATATRDRVQQAFLQLNADLNSFFVSHNPPTSPSDSLAILQRKLALNRLEEILLLAIMENRFEERRSYDPRIQQVLERITDDLREWHTVEALAQMVALSPSRLAHLFKQEVGSPLIQTILELRLKQAARLLAFTNHNIEQIATEVGFRSPFYFSRQFSNHYGLSPTAYRYFHTTHP